MSDKQLFAGQATRARPNALTGGVAALRGGGATLAAFLLGGRDSIERCAATPGLWRIGFLLTITAAIARSYDGAYFPAQPWRLLVPAAASLSTAGLLYLELWRGRTRREIAGPAQLIPFPRWLALVWLTAPLAWLYAIPYERWLDIYDAALANMITLALVSAWRVALMIRCLRVVHVCSLPLAIGIVMSVASFVALIAVLVSASAGWPSPIVIMGGLRVEPGYARNQEISSSSCATTALALLGFSAYYGFVGFRREQWRSFESVSSAAQPVRLLPTAVAALIIGVAACAVFQPEQAVRHRLEALRLAAYRTENFETYMLALAEAYPHRKPVAWSPLVAEMALWTPPEITASMARHAVNPASPGWLREELRRNLRAMWKQIYPRPSGSAARVLAATFRAVPPEALWKSEAEREELCQYLRKVERSGPPSDEPTLREVRERVCDGATSRSAL